MLGGASYNVVTFTSDSCYHLPAIRTKNGNWIFITECGKPSHEWREKERVIDREAAVYLGYHACKDCFEIAGGVMFYPGREAQ